MTRRCSELVPPADDYRRLPRKPFTTSVVYLVPIQSFIHLLDELLCQDKVLSARVKFFLFQKIGKVDLQALHFGFHLGNLCLQESLLVRFQLGVLQLLLGFSVLFGKTRIGWMEVRGK